MYINNFCQLDWTTLVRWRDNFDRVQTIQNNTHGTVGTTDYENLHLVIFWFVLGWFCGREKTQFRWVPKLQVAIVTTAHKIEKSTSDASQMLLHNKEVHTYWNRRLVVPVHRAGSCLGQHFHPSVASRSTHARNSPHTLHNTFLSCKSANGSPQHFLRGICMEVVSSQTGFNSL